jgi:hypothetical protein
MTTTTSETTAGPGGATPAAWPGPHADLPLYVLVTDCDHAEPAEGTPAWDDWAQAHPEGAGPSGEQVCLLAENGRYCPECTRIAGTPADPGNCPLRAAVAAGIAVADRAAAAAGGPGRYVAGWNDSWHAVRRVPGGGPGGWVPAVCGQPARVTAPDGTPRPAWGALDGRCPECSWTAAAETGRLDGELARLAPSRADAGFLAGLMPDPGIAVTAAACLIGAAVTAGDDRPGRWPVQVLASVTRHAPVLVLDPACTDGSCQHAAAGGGVCPPGIAVCGTCSLPGRGPDGEPDGTWRPECVITAPCAPLTELAASARAALDSANHAASLRRSRLLGPLVPAEEAASGA